MLQVSTPPVIMSGSPTRSVLTSATDSPMTPKRLSQGKLAPSHNIFMVSIDGSPKVNKNNSSKAAASPSIGISSSSSKVIESLHDQIDTLTNTNLQLTIQSHSLLEKLDAAQQKESQFHENITSLRHENENLNSMLSRKTRKLKDTEDELNELKQKFDQMLKENTSLKSNVEQSTLKETQLQEQSELYKAQYDAIVESQQYYRNHYNSEVTELKQQIEELKKSQINQLQKIKEHHLSIDDKMDHFHKKYKDMKELEDSRYAFLDVKCQEAISELDLPSWVRLYKESKNQLFDYSDKMQLNISDKYKDLARDEALVALEGKTNTQLNSIINENSNNSISNNNSVPLRMSKRSSYINTQQQQQQQQMPYHSYNNVNSSTSSNLTPTTSNSNNNGSIKRKSFYGGTMPVSNTQSTGSQGTLPGVKRSGSVRKASVNRRSLSAGDGPLSQQNQQRIPSQNFNSSMNPNVNGNGPYMRNQSQPISDK
ncbi:hypothetical protein TBLA_0F03210 [Henningerozyma blattae CBS 6284]|uniref:SWI5-dependent HO expression protein 3 n=1 Tax=Henningerozyma blattae (strain ATCC 34711 / CBS 6284 / DSM 70876 / NBRC 10599 / NRRL Y-10934 / UCD 77-7) TaxID=1071380 RepID=I2H657_HENB6|nr:hypothetical protein TBLA_0F03210 [Tetrapisispora blattae CBS 6284]CCH61859.1 hypothetical protein TBLA_0F03210 [Tetrapisispora blattae CBS 6284]